MGIVCLILLVPISNYYSNDLKSMSYDSEYKNETEIDIVQYFRSLDIQYKEKEFRMYSIMISSFGVILILIGGFFLIYTTIFKNPMQLMFEERILAIDEELELLEISENQYEKRAEVQFKNHQKELKRYYDINLGHLKWVFPLGIGVILLGIGIIIFSILIFKNIVVDTIIPTLIGAISGLMVDFIGAIFIKMYIETIKASTEFHNQLIHSNNNLFANVLVTKINDNKLKNETFSEIAKIISMNK